MPWTCVSFYYIIEKSHNTYKLFLYYWETHNTYKLNVSDLTTGNGNGNWETHNTYKLSVSNVTTGNGNGGVYFLDWVMDGGLQHTSTHSVTSTLYCNSRPNFTSSVSQRSWWISVEEVGVQAASALSLSALHFPCLPWSLPSSHSPAAGNAEGIFHGIAQCGAICRSCALLLCCAPRLSAELFGPLPTLFSPPLSSNLEDQLWKCVPLAFPSSRSGYWLPQKLPLQIAQMVPRWPDLWMLGKDPILPRRRDPLTSCRKCWELSTFSTSNELLQYMLLEWI